MSRTKHPRGSIELTVMKEALIRMTERCVHAEARATIAEAEVVTLKRHVEQLKADAHTNDWEKRRLWLVMWTLKGVKPETLVKFRIEVMRESREEAERLVYSGRWCYSLSGIDGVPNLEIVLPERAP